MIADSVDALVLDDVFLNLHGFLPGRTTFLKLEGLNPAGSIKLKTAAALIDSAAASGRLAPGARLIESTSGNLGIALAMVCAERELPLTVVTDPNVNRQSLRLMTALGAEVVQVADRDANGGFLKTRIDYIVDRLVREPDMVWLNQYQNQANPRTHQSTTARAVLAELGRVDCLFVGVGTSGTLMGCVDYFAEHSPETALFGVDSVGSITFGGPPGPRHLPGLGSSRRPEIFRPDAGFTPVSVPEADAVAMCRRLARERGLLVGASTGTVLAAVERAAEHVPPAARIAALSPDLGDRYVDTVYCDEWVAERFPSVVGELAAAA